MSIVITNLARADIGALDRVAPGVFDHPIAPELSEEFLNDPRHHLVVAIDDAVVVGMASAVHYVHPDKASQLWINEVGVAPTHQNRGIGKQLISELLKIARQLACTEAWVLTDHSNSPAMRLYANCGGAEAPRDQVMFTFKL